MFCGCVCVIIFFKSCSMYFCQCTMSFESSCWNVMFFTHFLSAAEFVK